MQIFKRAVSAHAAGIVSLLPTLPNHRFLRVLVQNTNKILRAGTDALNRKVQILQHGHKLLEKAHNILLDEADALRQDSSAFSRKADTFQQESNILLKENDVLKHANQTLEAARDTLEKRNDVLASDVSECNDLLLMADSRLTEAEDKLTAAVEALTVQCAETVNYRVECETLVARVEDLNGRNAIMEFQLGAVELSLKAAETRAISLEEELQKARQQEAETSKERDDLAIDNVDYLQKVLKLEDELYAVEKEKVALVARLEAELGAANQVEDLTGEVDTLRREGEQLKRALGVAEQRVEQENTNARESMASLYLGQEKAKALVQRLTQSDELIAMANRKADVLSREVSELKAATKLASDHAFEKQVEIEFLRQQEQDALRMCQLEEVARAAAEKERDDMVLKMVALAADMKTLKSRQQELHEQCRGLEDRNKRLEDQSRTLQMQLGREWKAHANTRNDLDRTQTRFAAVTGEKENQQLVSIKSSTPTHRSSGIFRRHKIPLQLRNSDRDISKLPILALPATPTSLKSRDDAYAARENSVITRSPTMPLSSPPGVYVRRRASSSSSSGQRSITDRAVSLVLLVPFLEC